MFIQDKAPGEVQEQVDDIGKYLINAATYIDKKGWAQRCFNDTKGSVCMLGALICVTPNIHQYAKARSRLANYIIATDRHLDLFDPCDTVTSYNDSAARTVGQVKDTLIKAAYHKPT